MDRLPPKNRPCHRLTALH